MYLAGWYSDYRQHGLLQRAILPFSAGIGILIKSELFLDNEKYCGDLILQKTYRNNHIEKKKLRNTRSLHNKYLWRTITKLSLKKMFSARLQKNVSVGQPIKGFAENVPH